jgi:hypothetical protein
LAAALEGYLAQTGNGSNLEIDIQSTQSQNSGERQFIVTVKDPGSAPAQTDPATGDAADATASATTPASTTANSSASTPANAAADTAPAPASAPTNEVDAYWAAQPPAVQQLRDISDFADRSAMAQQLANQGYIIDKAIMVWGWDPMKTMQTRQAYGYTWAPSLNQGNVTVPGISFPGETPYDPNNPPPGSIAVNTDFADGLAAG